MADEKAGVDTSEIQAKMKVAAGHKAAMGQRVDAEEVGDAVESAAVGGNKKQRMADMSSEEVAKAVKRVRENIAKGAGGGQKAEESRARIAAMRGGTPDKFADAQNIEISGGKLVDPNSDDLKKVTVTSPTTVAGKQNAPEQLGFEGRGFDSAEVKEKKTSERPSDAKLQAMMDAGRGGFKGELSEGVVSSAEAEGDKWQKSVKPSAEPRSKSADAAITSENLREAALAISESVAVLDDIAKKVMKENSGGERYDSFPSALDEVAEKPFGKKEALEGFFEQLQKKATNSSHAEGVATGKAIQEFSDKLNEKMPQGQEISSGGVVRGA